MRKFILLAALIIVTIGAAFVDAQTRRRMTVEDAKWGGSYTRAYLNSTGNYTVNGFTPINVLSYGVDNTGATDCSDSLQAAINAVEALGGGLHLPPGDYKIGTSLQVDNASGNQSIEIYAYGAFGKAVMNEFENFQFGFTFRAAGHYYGNGAAVYHLIKIFFAPVGFYHARAKFRGYPRG